MTAVTVRAEGKTLHVASPYSADFVSTIRCLGGKWQPESRTWAVPAKQAAALRDLLLRVYGADGGLPPPPAPKAGKAATAAPAAAPAPPAPRPAPCRPPTAAEIDVVLTDMCVGWAGWEPASG